jgi:(p)ppGpp synthase/HD superfamily hydrolase
MLEKAIELALKYHKGQIKNGTGEEFILHVLRVMMKMNTVDEKIAAVLHDIVEKSNCSLEELKNHGFSNKIINTVDALSKRRGEDYSDYIGRVKKDPAAVKIKIADLEDNMDIKNTKELTLVDIEKMNRRKKYYRELKELPRH